MDVYVSNPKPHRVHDIRTRTAICTGMAIPLERSKFLPL
jgi:hypothetical protein